MSEGNAGLHAYDLAVIGAGVAGLWTAARAGTLGSRTLLVSAGPIGGGQTIASQGIIHGGIKYALTGEASRASRAISEMPGVWSACLRGEGETDLRGVRVLSPRQHLWTTAGVGSRLMAVAASRVIRTGVTALPRGSAERREFFGGASEAEQRADVYAVEEAVLDAHSVVESLADRCVREGVEVRLARAAEGVRVVRRGAGWGVLIDGDEALAARVVLAAGAGNEALLSGMDAENAGNVRMQRRPLHMVLVRSVEGVAGTGLPRLYGHCVSGGLTDKPRVTVTTHESSGGRAWYVGGLIAEEGVGRSEEDQIAAARRELAECVPWASGALGAASFATFRIDRAEGLTVAGKRPDTPVVRSVGEGAAVAWPTKLAFAPLTARMALAAVGLEEQGAERHRPRDREVGGTSVAGTIAPLPWEREGVRWT